MCAWTAPRTWTVSQIVTAAQLNTDIRDNENALSTHAHTGAAGDGALIGGVNYTTTARWEDDFGSGLATTGQLGVLGWTISLANAGTLAFQAAIADHPGVVRLTTGATSGTRCAISLPLGATTLPAEDFDIRAVVRLNVNDSNTQVRVGLSGSAGSNPPDAGIYLEKDGADTQWFGVTRTSPSQTRSTAVASTSTNWVTLRARRVNGTTIGFTVDGGTEQTNTANIPTAGLAPFIEITNEAAAQDKTIDIDFVRLDITAISR